MWLIQVLHLLNLSELMHNDTIIIKPNKNHTFTSRYQPIYHKKKFISKALSTRTDTVTLFVIHINKTGFTKGQQANNKHILFNKIHQTNHIYKETIVTTLEAATFLMVSAVNYFYITKFGFGKVCYHGSKH